MCSIYETFRVLGFKNQMLDPACQSRSCFCRHSSRISASSLASRSACCRPRDKDAAAMRLACVCPTISDSNYMYVYEYTCISLSHCIHIYICLLEYAKHSIHMHITTSEYADVYVHIYIIKNTLCIHVAYCVSNIFTYCRLYPTYYAIYCI